MVSIYSYIIKLKKALWGVVSLLIIAFGLLSLPSASVYAKNKADFTVVIDAGHGGHDHGAIDNGAREKDINLGVAKKFASMVKKKLKDVNVVMTRDDDTFVSLQERANIANRNKGDLFISIHTNSVDKSNPNRKKVSGASVYALGAQKDANNLKVAQRENSVIELESDYQQKYSGFDPSKDESYIIFEMVQKKSLGKSLKFADKAQKELVKTAGRNDRGVRQAGFWVLWATSMPAVLVELDFICNPQQAAFLNSEDGQEKLAKSLCNALEQYVESLLHKSADQSIEIVHPSNESVNVSNNGLLLSNGADNKEESSSNESGNNGTAVIASNIEKESKSGVAPIAIKRNTNAPRRRRSSASKIVSDNRVFETSTIELRKERDFLAVYELKEEEPTAEIAKTETADNDRDNKQNKKKNKTSKTAKSAKDTASKSSVKISTSNSANSNKEVASVNKNQSTIAGNSGKSSARKTAKGNTKTFLVTSGKKHTYANLQTKPIDVTPKKEKSEVVESNSVTTTSVNKVKRPRLGSSQYSNAPTEYKILLLSSEMELKTDDPVFCGITPTEVYHENNLYKYIYGGSTNRRQVEKKLLEIKSLIPEAVIIVK